MKAATMGVLILVGMSACATEKQAASPGPTETTPPAPAPTSTTQAVVEIPVGLSAEAGARSATQKMPCQVNPVGTAYARRDDVVRWTFTVMTNECKKKKVKIKKLAEQIDCADHTQTLASGVPLPLEDCEQDLVTGELNSTLRITCSVRHDIPSDWKCYKYTIGGDVINGDPEIEIERPRLSPPVTPSATPPPPTVPRQ
jgi:hypothetical protein